MPALSDNYMYVIIDKATRQAAIVDAVEPEKCLSAVEQAGAEHGGKISAHVSALNPARTASTGAAQPTMPAWAVIMAMVAALKSGK